MQTDNNHRPDSLQEKLGRLVAIVAKLCVIDDIPRHPDRARMGLELIKLADEVGAPMGSKTRQRLLLKARYNLPQDQRHHHDAILSEGQQ